MNNRLGVFLAVLGLAGTVIAPYGAAQAPAMQKGIHLELPVTSHAVPMPDADRSDALIVAITARGAVYFGITPVSPDGLAEKVKSALSSDTAARVYVKGDARTPYARVEEVLDALRTAAVDATALLTSQRDSSDNGSFMPPKGLAVRIGPSSPRLQDGSDKVVQVNAGGQLPFGDVVHVIDVCRSAGAKIFLVTPGM